MTGPVRVRAVVPAYGCGEHLARTLAAWERARARAGAAVETVVVLPAGDPAVALVGEAPAGLSARAVEVGPDEIATPGASRNRGAAGAAAEFLLFLDGDVETEEGFVARALGGLERRPEAGGWGGRLDERHWRGGREAGTIADAFRVGPGGPAAYLAQLWLCRRAAFEQAGGFDPRLPSEEDFELGLRLRERGWALHAEPALAGVHHCAARPTLAELRRRWGNGMYTGQGLALRHAWGTPRFAPLLARQGLYLAALAGLAAGLGALSWALAGRAWPLTLWLAAVATAWLAMAARKRSARLAALSLATWAVQGVALARTLLVGPWGRHAAAARVAWPAAGGSPGAPADGPAGRARRAG